MTLKICKKNGRIFRIKIGHIFKIALDDFHLFGDFDSGCVFDVGADQYHVGPLIRAREMSGTSECGTAAF